jgi:large-conductance mechanosensitive channel
VAPPPGGAYGSYPGYRTPETDGAAIGALIAAIVAWVICPLVPAVVALVLAGTAERNIAASRGWKTGSGLVSAARIVAWINIGLVLAGLVFMLLVAAASA